MMRNVAVKSCGASAIHAAIACGDLIRARNIGLDILRYYPSSPELHHRTALAAAR